MCSLLMRLSFVAAFDCLLEVMPRFRHLYVSLSMICLYVLPLQCQILFSPGYVYYAVVVVSCGIVIFGIG